jgi:hypothetical protein
MSTAHDPKLVEVAWQAWLKADSIHSGVEAVIAAVEPIIRDDQRRVDEVAWDAMRESTIYFCRRDLAEEIAQAIEAMPSVRPTFSRVVFAEEAAEVARRLGGAQ